MWMAFAPFIFIFYECVSEKRRTWKDMAIYLLPLLHWNNLKSFYPLIFVDLGTHSHTQPAFPFSSSVSHIVFLTYYISNVWTRWMIKCVRLYVCVCVLLSMMNEKKEKSFNREKENEVEANVIRRNRREIWIELYMEFIVCISVAMVENLITKYIVYTDTHIHILTTDPNFKIVNIVYFELFNYQTCECKIEFSTIIFLVLTFFALVFLQAK